MSCSLFQNGQKWMDLGGILGLGADMWIIKKIHQNFVVEQQRGAEHEREGVLSESFPFLSLNFSFV